MNDKSAPLFAVARLLLSTEIIVNCPVYMQTGVFFGKCRQQTLF